MVLIAKIYCSCFITLKKKKKKKKKNTKKKKQQQQQKKKKKHIAKMRLKVEPPIKDFIALSTLLSTSFRKSFFALTFYREKM